MVRRTVMITKPIHTPQIGDRPNSRSFSSRLGKFAAKVRFYSYHQLIKEQLFSLFRNFFNRYKNIIKWILPRNSFGDRLFSKLLFLSCHNRLPNSSMTFNDILFRIKASQEIINPLRVLVSDKELVRYYIVAVVGDKYNVPLHSVLRKRADIKLHNYPDTCCIKPTHLSGKYILRRNSDPINFQLIDRWWDLNHYDSIREANYKHLQPKVIVEELLNDEEFIEYYCFCYHGEPRMFFVSVDQTIEKKRILFDSDWNELDFSLGFPKSNRKLPKPDNFDEMIFVAKRLSSAFDFIRVDFYSNGSACFVGEITNCHASAMQRFVPATAEQEASRIIFG